MASSRLPRKRQPNSGRVRKKVPSKAPSAQVRPEAPPSRLKDRESANVIVVLGMHRSGTSAVAGTLMKLCGGTPKHFMVGPSNPRGFFESLELMRFHDELLASAGSSWQDWRLFNPEWYRSPVVAEYKQRAEDLFGAEFGGSALAVLKDPRICRFVPFWLDVLREMQKTPRVVIPIRSPLDVAHSLKKRDGMSLTKGMLLWLRHVLDAEAQSRSEARSIFAWNEFNSDWRRVCDKVAADTGLSWPRLSDRASREIDNFLTKDLVHHETDHAALVAHSDVHEWTLRAYEALVELARSPSSNSALDTLDQVRALLDQSSKMFGRILVDYEIDIEDLRGQTHAATSERDLLRVRQSEILAENAAAFAERDALGEERARITAELQARQQELAEAARVELARSKGEIERLNAIRRRNLAWSLAARSRRKAIAQRILALEARAAGMIEKRAAAASLVRRTIRLRGKRTRLEKLWWRIRAAVQPEKTDLAILRRSLYLDEEWYLATYTDVAAAGMRPAEHYMAVGAKLGLDPGPFFSTRDYLANNPEVAKAGLNPLLHFEKVGMHFTHLAPGVVAFRVWRRRGG